MKKLLLITAAIAAFMLFCVKDVNAQNIDTSRSKAFGYAWTQAELDSFPQKTNCPSVYLNVYKTTYDASTGTTSFTDGSLEDLSVIFGEKNDWYYITKIAIRDDNGSIQERNEWTGIRGRGNATWDINEIKKPLRIKFPKKTALLTTKDADGNIVNNNATAKSWTLLANYYDATQVHNGMTYELTSYLGMEFCPAAVYVDMFVNGRYMGTYQISDHVQVADKRIPIIENVGYFFEANSGKRTGFLEDPYMKVSYGNGDMFVNIKSPDPDPAYAQTVESWRITPSETSDPKFSPLKAHLEKVSKLAFNGPYNVEENWRKYVDMTSCVNAFIGTDVTGDYDGVVANNYAYMADIYSPIKFGPIWDFDLAWGAKVSGKDMTQQHFWEAECYGFGYLVKQVYENDPYFVKALYERWQEVYNDGELITYLQGRANYWITHNYWTDRYNYLAVDKGGAGWSLNKGWADSGSAGYQNVDQAYDDLQAFIYNHIHWLDEQYKAKYEAMGCASLPEIGEGGGNEEGLVYVGNGKLWSAGEEVYYFYGSAQSMSEGATLTIVLEGNNARFSAYTKNQYSPWKSTWGGAPLTTVYTLTADDVASLKENGYMFTLAVSDGTCVSITLEGGSGGSGSECEHDYANCNYTITADGTYRRVCNICSTPELDGEPYYQFVIYPESATERTMMGTTWKPEDLGVDAQGNALYPNAIAKVKVTADVAANIKDGVNIVNVTGEQVCQNLVITDGHPYYCDKKFTAIKSTYSRKMKNDWGTIILPYKYQQASNETASFYHLSAVNESADGRITLLLMPINPDIDGDASAYTPVFVKRKGNAEAITVDGENITVKKSTADKTSSTVADWTLYGAIEQTETVTDEYAYYVANNTFYQNDGSFTVNPFRAYIKYSGLDLPAKTIGITADGDEGIASSLQTVSTDDCLAIFIDNGQISVGAPADMNVAITTLGGALVKSANMAKGSTITVSVPAGIYLVNGVKVLVK